MPQGKLQLSIDAKEVFPTHAFLVWFMWKFVGFLHSYVHQIYKDYCLKIHCALFTSPWMRPCQSGFRNGVASFQAILCSLIEIHTKKHRQVKKTKIKCILMCGKRFLGTEVLRENAEVASMDGQNS